MSYAELKYGIGSRVSSFFTIYGESIVTTDNYLTLPIRSDDSFIIEPEFIYIDSTEEVRNRERTSTVKGVTIGFFKLLNIGSVLRPYAGLRLGILEEKYKDKDLSSSITATETDSHKVVTSSLGIEYELFEDFTFASEVGVSYVKSDNADAIKSDSRLMIRMVF